MRNFSAGSRKDCRNGVRGLCQGEKDTAKARRPSGTIVAIALPPPPSPQPLTGTWAVLFRMGHHDAWLGSPFITLHCKVMGGWIQLVSADPIPPPPQASPSSLPCPPNLPSLCSSGTLLTPSTNLPRQAFPSQGWSRNRLRGRNKHAVLYSIRDMRALNGASGLHSQRSH